VTNKSVHELVDLDLPPVRRAEANYWKAMYFEARAELAKANKGIARLQRRLKRRAQPQEATRD
jgi:hypothetical protein